MARGKAHSDETRAMVMAALLAGQRIAEVADEHDIPESTIRRWRREIPADVREQVGQKMAAKKEADLAELIGVYLIEILTTLSAQARIARDEQWLKRQDASSFAVLHGVLTDKALRILAAIEPEEDASST